MTADPVKADAVTVFPGMEIRQESTLCTLATSTGATRRFLRRPLPRQRTRHRSGGPDDRGGHHLPRQHPQRHRGAHRSGDLRLRDRIALAADVTINSVLPSGRQLVADPTVVLAAGQQVCHFGVITGESCGTIERVNNGWFTMENGVVSQKGDSGGPVYTHVGDGTAVIIGLFNSTWGHLCRGLLAGDHPAGAVGHGSRRCRQCAAASAGPTRPVPIRPRKN